MNEISFRGFIGKKIIEIVDRHPIFALDDGGFIVVECPWRLREGNKILLGSSEYDFNKTKEEAYQKLINLILGEEIKEIELLTPISDLRITFVDNLYLELFSDSSNYENWSISNGIGCHLVSMVGGDYCYYQEC